MHANLNSRLLSLLMMATGRATLTKGTSQAVTVDTDPSGAVCTLTRDAKPVAIVNPTPGSVPVEKAQGPIAVACTKQGFLDAAGKLASEFQAMTFGNILFGGIVGVVRRRRVRRTDSSAVRHDGACRKTIRWAAAGRRSRHLAHRRRPNAVRGAQTAKA